MQKRTLKVALLAVVALILVLGFSGSALAATWPDMPDTVTAPYGVTDNQVAAISQGFTDGLWRPYQSVTRAQFIKMAVDASHTAYADPAVATFTDVPKGSHYFKYVEGAVAAGLVLPGTTLGPNEPISRLDAISIMSRWISQANGINLATYYTPAEIAGLLSHFADAALIPAASQALVAFAVDMDITRGTKGPTGLKLDPTGKLTRIQGATFLIRAQEKVPPAQWTAAKIEILSGDKAENLIGKTHTVTFKVTDAAGHPAVGVLVDFDTLMGSAFYVGNVQPEAAVTDSFGQVKVNLISHEPGTQKLSATVATNAGGLATLVATKYWVALDEVYILDPTRASQNNAGQAHTWSARAVVFGPGPLSTSAQDWYNAINPNATGVLAGVDWPIGWVVAELNKVYHDLLPAPGKELTAMDADELYDWAMTWLAAHSGVLPDDPDLGEILTLVNLIISTDRWSYQTEQLAAAHGYLPRTMAGIDMNWSIVNVVNDDPRTTTKDETVPSVGLIQKLDGVALTPAATTAKGKTNAAGLSSIEIYSEKTGQNKVQVVADYPENPYPGQLFNHLTSQINLHFLDWDDQPIATATALKTWISHTLPSTSGPITGAGMANIGEEKTMVITLVDVYGNPVVGREVEWFMQGAGFFQTDDGGDTSDPKWAAGNKDFDVTDKNGKAEVFIKSFDAGEQIVHAKVRDKGTGGAEGAWSTYTAEMQWFDVDVATFDNPATHTVWTMVWDAVKDDMVNVPTWNNEALSSNPVGGTHTFDMWVYGLKLEYAPTIWDADGQTPWIDGDVVGSAYDGIIDAKDAAYFGGILLVNDNVDDSDWAYDYDEDGIIDNNANERGIATVKVAGRTLTLSLVGGYTEFDWNQDGYKEQFTGQTGIYLPLEGKDVTFAMANQVPGLTFSNLGAMFNGSPVKGVGTITTSPAKDVTDAAGMVSVTVASTVKGPQTIRGTVDWAGNPHNGPELLSAYAKKLWMAGAVAGAGDISLKIYIDDLLVATGDASGKITELADGESPFYLGDPEDGELNWANVEVHVLDAYGNDLPDYEVVYLLESIDSWLDGTQQSANTYIPWAYLVDKDTDNLLGTPAVAYDQNGTRPDSNEPEPADDPYATIVGLGGTPAFFFNQWLTSEVGTDAGQPGIEFWPYGAGSDDFDDYSQGSWDMAETLSEIWTGDSYYWSREDLFDGFDGFLDDIAPDEVGLATDGAKAWTLDGFYRPGEWTTDTNEPVYVKGDAVMPNMLTGSNIDIQLAMDPQIDEAVTHYKSILGIKVYAPAKGLVVGGHPIWSTQVHQVWGVPVPTSITLTPATDYAIAGIEEQTVVATVLDQYGNPVPNASIDFFAAQLEGFGLTTGNIDLGGTLTDADGKVAFTWPEAAGDWGVQTIYAYWDPNGANDPATYGSSIFKSGLSTIQWIFDDSTGTLAADPAGTFDAGPADLVQAYTNEQKVYVSALILPWTGRTLSVFLNPGAASIGGPVSYTAAAVSVSISTGASTWVEDQAYFVKANNSTNTDHRPNWVYDVVAVD